MIFQSITILVLLTRVISLQPDLMTYMLTPERYSQTLVEGEVTVPHDLYNFTFCLRVKPRLSKDASACEPIAVSYKDRNTGAELLTIRSTMDEKRPNTSQLVLKVWTKDCPEVFHFNQQSNQTKNKTIKPQLKCDGIWRTICIRVIHNSDITLFIWRLDEGEAEERKQTTRPCKDPKQNWRHLIQSDYASKYKFETPIIKTGGKFAFNTIQVKGSTITSDSRIKDVMLWGTAFEDPTTFVKQLARGDVASIPNRNEIVWIFNSRAALMQSGTITVKERPYGKGLLASPQRQLIERGEKAVLTCQVILNDFPRSNTSIGEGAVRWFHQDTSKDDMTKLEKNRGHAHEVQRTTEDDDGEMSIYTLESSDSDPFTEGWFYCQRDRIKGIERLQKSNIVHITVAEKVCKANKRIDEKYGTLEFAAAIPGNYSLAKCLGGEAKMLCSENKTWDVLNSNFSCNTLIFNTLSDIINSYGTDAQENGTTPHPSALYEISPRDFDKMTNEDFLLVVRAVEQVRKYLYDLEGHKRLMEWVDELTELPPRVPITTKQSYPEKMEEIAVSMTDYSGDTDTLTLDLEHINVLTSKSVKGGKELEIGDRTRPNVKISTAGDTDWLVALYYREYTWFRADTHDRDIIIHSPVVGIRMSNLTALPITIVFHKNYNSNNKSRCVYWDLEKVDWSSDNCTTQELDGGKVKCICNHLTSFAILMDPFTDGVINPFQTYLTKAVLSVSIIFFILSISIWMSFKTLRSKTYIRLRSSFTSCLCASFFFFLVTAESPAGSQACFCFTFLTQWMFLTAFGWMALDAYWLRLKVVHSLDSFGAFPRHFFKKAFLGTFGTSLAITSVNVLAAEFEDSLSYLHSDLCWLDKTSQTYFLLLPMYGVLCFNIWTFCQVAGIIFTVNKLSQSSNTYFKKQLRSVLCVALSLGCTWLIAPLLFIRNSAMKEAVQFIFTITNGLQGIFIFIFFTILQPDVKQELMMSLSRRRSSWSTNTAKVGEKAFRELAPTEENTEVRL